MNRASNDSWVILVIKVRTSGIPWFPFHLEEKSKKYWNWFCPVDTPKHQFLTLRGINSLPRGITLSHFLRI